MAKNSRSKYSEQLFFSLTPMNKTYYQLVTRTTFFLKYKWNRCNHMPMLSFLETNNCLPLFHEANFLICNNETKKRKMSLRLYICFQQCGSNMRLFDWTYWSFHTFFNCSLKVFLVFKPGLIIYTIVNSFYAFLFHYYKLKN